MEKEIKFTHTRTITIRIYFHLELKTKLYIVMVDKWSLLIRRDWIIHYQFHKNIIKDIVVFSITFDGQFLPNQN